MAQAGEFFGKLGFVPNPADQSGRTQLLEADFGFEDANGLRWQASKGDVTDGASIPSLLQPIVGGRWNPAFLPAAVIHDHYCDKNHHVREWRQTHRVFYDALLTSSVGRVKAKAMYYAVYTFGPRWDKLSRGVPCGENCINSTAQYNEFFRPASYDNPANQAEIKQAESEIEALDAAEGISLDQIERMSDARHANDMFLRFSVTR